MTRQEIESMPNWAGTFYSTRAGKFHCLMRAIHKGFFWYAADYDGLFPAGATYAYSEAELQYSVKHRILAHISGHNPLAEGSQCLRRIQQPDAAGELCKALGWALGQIKAPVEGRPSADAAGRAAFLGERTEHTEARIKELVNLNTQEDGK